MGWMVGAWVSRTEPSLASARSVGRCTVMMVVTMVTMMAMVTMMTTVTMMTMVGIARGCGRWLLVVVEAISMSL